MKLPFLNFKMTPADSDGGIVDLILKFLPPLLVLVTLVGLYAWQIDNVRITFVDHFEILGNQAALNALSDPSPKVAQRACAQILEHDLAFKHPEVLPTLSNRPKVALACLENSIGTDQTRIEGIQPHDRVVAYRLGHMWHERLMSAEVDKEMSCEITDYISHAIELSNWASEDLLFDCAVSATSAEPRRCCQQAFEEEHLADLIENPEWFELEYATKRLPKYAALSFGFALAEPPEPADSESADSESADSESADSESADSDKEQAEQDAKADAQDASPIEYEVGEAIERTDLQDWTFAQGCRVLNTEKDGYTAITAFEPVFNTKTCHSKSETPRGYYDKSNWLVVCDHLYDDQRAQGRAPAEAICGSLKQATVMRAVDTARVHVNIATRVHLPGVGAEFNFPPQHAAFAAKPLNLGGRGAAVHRTSGSSPALRGFFSQLMPGL
jgi:hypothetical protein